MTACSVPAVQPDRFRFATYLVAAGCLAASIAAGSISLPLALVPVAALLGWSHLSSV